METLIIKLLFGHFIGDFLFQTRNMASNKYVSGWRGFSWCTIHILVYTLTMTLFTNIYSPIFIIGISIPHWIIDRYSLGYQWMKLIDRSYMLNSDKSIENSFGSIIYVVIDQTFHFICLYYLFKII